MNTFIDVINVVLLFAAYVITVYATTLTISLGHYTAKLVYHRRFFEMLNEESMNGAKEE